MLAGVRAFPGEDVTETLAAIMRAEPDWSRLPSLPPPVSALLRRCLIKDPRHRIGDMAAVRFALNLPREEVQGRSRSTWKVAAAALGLTVVALALWAATALSGQPANAPQAPLRVTATLPRDLSLRGGHNSVSISPDGTKVVVVGGDDEEGSALWLRQLGSRTVTKLQGTDGAMGPFWSPDGQEVAFFADRELKVVSLAGGTPQVLADAPFQRGGSWAGDTLLFVPRHAGAIATVGRTGGAVQFLEHTKDLTPMWRRDRLAG